MAEKMIHYANICMNNGNHKKQIREFARGLGLEKRFLRKIFEDENSRIKYKLSSKDPYESTGRIGIFGGEETIHTTISMTEMDIYAKNKEKAMGIYDNLESLFDKIRKKNGDKGLGVFITRD